MSDWIFDRNPDKSGDYLVFTKNGFIQVAKWGYGLYKSGGWNGHCKNCIVAWMPLPEPPYKEDNNGTERNNKSIEKREKDSTTRK